MKKILIAEDEHPLARALEVKLTKAGFEAKAVHNGQEALDLLQTFPADLILLDLLMPQVDGFSFLQKAKEQGVSAKIIITSNLSQTEDIEKAKALGAVDFLVKSDSSLADIVEKVQTTLQI